MNDTLPFGLWLKKRRKALDLTQSALADRVGCSQATIEKIKAEERRPSAQIAELLADALEIPRAERATFLRVARGQRAATGLDSIAPIVHPPQDECAASAHPANRTPKRIGRHPAPARQF